MSQSDDYENEVLQKEPDVEKMNNGAVRIVLDISDPVAELGIMTTKVSVESEKSFVTEELAEHLWDELFIDVDDYDIEVVE